MNIPTIAICYDFDMTLSPKNMQEYSFFEEFGTTPEEFWGEQNNLIKTHNADMILMNMYGIVELAKKKNILLTKEKLKEYGKSIELYAGVETWFDRINEYGRILGVNIEHYIVSSGIKEMILGTSIAKHFKKIYACSYIYNEKGEAIWPAISVNYTNKTQYLHRINKGCLEETDDAINDIMSQEDRFVPFENMIYIGDSDTDIPCMRQVMKSGGKAIGVYNNEQKKLHLNELLKNNKINYVSVADYQKGKMLEIIVKEIIKSNKINFNLKKLSQAQKASSN